MPRELSEHLNSIKKVQSKMKNTLIEAIVITKVEEIKGIQIGSIQIGKEEIKLSLFADDMILFIENPKDSTKNY